jgi:integrase
VIIRRAFSGTVLRQFMKTKRVRVIPRDQSWRDRHVQHPRNINLEEFACLKDKKPYSMTRASKKWKEAAGKAEYPNINLYQGTRHSLASQAVNRDVPLCSVSKFLRHTNVT